MPDFRVLYLEHEDIGVAYSQALCAVPASVDSITQKSPESVLRELHDRLERNRYDLIVTDAYWPENGSNDSTGRQRFLLPEIVKEVRNADDYRVKIGVLTQFGEELFGGEVEECLSKVDYVWYKDTTTQTFLAWQVRRIQETVSRTFPNHLLLSKLRSMVEASDSKAPNKLLIASIIRGYTSHRGEPNKVEAILGHLSSIADDCGLESEYRSLFESFKKSEPVNVAGNINAWGHLRHVLNVYWLGYYLLNSGHLDLTDAWRAYLGKTKSGNLDLSNEDEMRRQLNAAWFLAATLHDIGLIGERITSISHDASAILSSFDVGKWDIHCQGIIADQEQLLSKLYGAVTSTTEEWLRKIVTKCGSRVDHGLLSSFVILKKMESKSRDPVVVRAASAAAAIHNLLKKAVDDGESISLRLSDDPIAALLVICDQIQVWERDTGYERLHSNIPLEAAELREIELGDRGIRLAIRYYPFREILPQDTAMGRMSQSIVEVIQNKLKPILKAVSSGDRVACKLHVDFELGSQSKLASWELLN